MYAFTARNGGLKSASRVLGPRPPSRKSRLPQARRRHLAGDGDRYSEGTVWNNLGSALRGVERFDEAITAHHHSIAICAELGDPTEGPRPETTSGLCTSPPMIGASAARVDRGRPAIRRWWCRGRRRPGPAGDRRLRSVGVRVPLGPGDRGGYHQAGLLIGQNVRAAISHTLPLLPTNHRCDDDVHLKQAWSTRLDQRRRPFRLRSFSSSIMIGP